MSVDVCDGVRTCSQMPAATMPKAKPARPVTKAAANVPPRNIASSNDKRSAILSYPDVRMLDVMESVLRKRQAWVSLVASRDQR